MAYFKINDTDFSHCVSGLKVKRTANYNSQTNAAGDTVVDYINHKRTITVDIIPIESEAMNSLQTVIANLEVKVSYRNPNTGALENCNCIIPDNEVSYYTIQANKVIFNEFTLTFYEL